MKRYSDTKRPGKPANTVKLTGLGLELTGLGFVLEQGGGEIVVEAQRRPPAHDGAFTRRHEPEFQAEPGGVYMMSTPNHIYLEHLRERMPAPGGGPSAGGCDVEDLTGDGARPEVERMLGRVLDDGGGGIVERLKDYEAKMASSPLCERPEIGRLVESYYVPLLLSALALDDREFDAEYPGDGPVSSEQRAELAEAIRRHSQECLRCSLKIASDREWEEHVNKAIDRESRRFRMRV